MNSKINHPNEALLLEIQSDEFLPPLGHWTIVGGLVVIAIMAIAIPVASTINYKVTVKALAAVRPAGELRLVQTAVEGPVITITAKENQFIKKGDLIAIVDDSRLETKKSQLQSSIQQARLQINQMNAQMNALNHQMQAETDRMNRAISSASAQLEGRRREYQDRQMLVISEADEGAADLRAAEAGLNAARSKRDRYQAVAASGALSQDQLEEVQFTAEQQAQMVEAAKAKARRAEASLNPTEAEVAIATEQIAQEQAGGRVSLAMLSKEHEALIQQRIELNKQMEQDIRELQQVQTDLNQTQIKATATGIITKLNLRNPGQTISAGQEIAQIVPSNTPLQIKATVSPDDIDKVKIGQIAQMRVSACPYPDYGVLNGKVRQISEDTVKPENSATNPNGKAIPAFYQVMIEPNSQALTQQHHQCSLQPGMEGRVDIVTREESVLKFILRKARLITDL